MTSVRTIDNTEVRTLFISVIVPVRNEARFIERTLAQLAGQDYDRDRFEVLVVDGESTDGTPDLVARFAAAHPNFRLFSNPRRLSSAARNIALREARGDVVLLVDGHCDLGRPNVESRMSNEGPDIRHSAFDIHYLRELAEAFQRSGADCLGRPQPQDIADPVPGCPATALQRAIAAARSSRLGHHPDSHVYNASEGFVPAKSVAVAYRREVFEIVGGFDERFDACEDVEFNHRVDRAGLRCFFTPRVAAQYAPRDTLRGLFRQLYRYGRGRIRLWRKHRETMSFISNGGRISLAPLKTLLPAIFVLGFIIGFVVALLSWWAAAAYATVLALYAAVVLGGSLAAAAARRDAAILPWLPLVFATIHFGAGAGLLWEGVAERWKQV